MWSQKKQYSHCQQKGGKVVYMMFGFVRPRTLELTGTPNSWRNRFRRSADCSSDANDVMHAAFSRIINKRTDDAYSSFHPEEQLLMEWEPKDGHLLSTPSSVCTLDARSEKVLPDQPLRERALCPYHHVLNYNPKRIPASITEVVCSCGSVTGGTQLHCEQMYFSLRVLLFTPDCGSFVETTQRVALACVPVFVNQVKVPGSIATVTGSSASVQT